MQHCLRVHRSCEVAIELRNLGHPALKPKNVPKTYQNHKQAKQMQGQEEFL